MGFLKGRLVNFLSDKDSLRRKIIASAALSTGVFAAQVVGRIASTVILTRILTPEIFGVFAVVMVFIYILEQFSDVGVRQLILTKEGELDDSFLRSCWTAQILRGLLIFCVCALLAFGVDVGQNTGFFPVDSSYAAAALPSAIAAMGAASIISGFASPAKYVYERRMQFRRASIEALVNTTLTIIITIGLAIWLRNIWALVLGYLAKALISVFLSYVLFSGPRMRLNWDLENFKVIVARGKWIVGNSSLSAIVRVADRFILGFAMSASSFGYYYIARQIVDLVELFLYAIHSQMGLQVFTALQEKGEAASLRNKYYRYRILFDGLAMFSAGAFLTFAPTLVDIIYDDRYADVAGMIQILAVGLILIGPCLLREAYSAQRRFREMMVLTLVSAFTIWVGLLIAIVGLGSETAALFVVALHRLPETALLLLKGRKESWVAWLYELRMLPFLLLGAAIGWGMAQAWAWLV